MFVTKTILSGLLLGAAYWLPAAADTKRGEALLGVTALHFVDQRVENAGA